MIHSQIRNLYLSYERAEKSQGRLFCDTKFDTKLKIQCTSHIEHFSDIIFLSFQNLAAPLKTAAHYILQTFTFCVPQIYTGLERNKGEQMVNYQHIFHSNNYKKKQQQLNAETFSMGMVMVTNPEFQPLHPLLASPHSERFLFASWGVQMYCTEEHAQKH